MFVRRSVRLNRGFSPSQTPGSVTAAVKQHVNPYSSPESERKFSEEKQEPHQQRYFNSPEIKQLMLDTKQKVEAEVPVTETPDVSATSKALNQMETEGMTKKKWKKGGKTPMALRRKKLNQRLSKLLTPKSALILLHELKPGCIYKVQEQPGCIPSSFCAQVEHENTVLGIGQGLSKSQAKNCAAENAIKAIVSRAMSRQSTSISPGENEKEEISDDEQEDTPENLPWAGLASFAIYKMFSEWQSQGADLLSLTRPALKQKPKPPGVINVPTKKELPPNAVDLHPAVVLNMMNPGLTAVEIEREDAPKCRVKMGYLIEGKMFTGVGGNKKDAKKEAAKAVLEGHYGLIYPR